MFKEIIHKIKIGYYRLKNKKVKKCNHDFEHPKLIAHGEDHGSDPCRRICKKCGRSEYLIQRRTGLERYKWIKRNI